MYPCESVHPYEVEVRQKWGSTAAYQEYEKKSCARSGILQSSLAEGLDQIFADFARHMQAGAAPKSTISQALVKQLQNYINANYYTCTNEILFCLGQMYTSDPRFQANLDRHAAGTAAYVSRCICIYCQ